MADHEVEAEADRTAAVAGILPAGTAGKMDDFPSAAPA
jgi:hypothetical protein